MLMAMFSQLIINYKIFEPSDKNDSPNNDYPVHLYNDTKHLNLVFEELLDWDEGRNSYPLLPTFTVSTNEIFTGPFFELRIYLILL